MGMETVRVGKAQRIGVRIAGLQSQSLTEHVLLLTVYLNPYDLDIHKTATIKAPKLFVPRVLLSPIPRVEQ